MNKASLEDVFLELVGAPAEPAPTPEKEEA